MTESNEMGTLYLVASPIGNLEDMTYRAVRTLKEVDYVFCEDTRRTSILLRHFDIETKNKIESFHDHSSRSVLQKIKQMLSDGAQIAYLTDAGMPAVSDPGFVLVRAAHECGAKVSVIPGPSAAVMLFAASGLPSPKYLFHGFFPRTRGEVERTIEVIRANPVVHIFYEAPGRIATSLEILARNLPLTPVVLGRELTKMHEEILHGTLSELEESLKERGKIKGECVVAVLGGDFEKKKALEQAPVAPLGEDGQAQCVTFSFTPEQEAEIAALVKSGVSSKDAAKELSKKYGVPRRAIYEFIIRHLT